MKTFKAVTEYLRDTFARVSYDIKLADEQMELAQSGMPAGMISIAMATKEMMQSAPKDTALARMIGGMYLMSDYWLLNNLKQGTDAIANNHISAHKKDGNLVRTAIARKP